MSQDSEASAPCPFCGRDPRMLEIAPCVWDESLAKAIAAWNRRAVTPEAVETPDVGAVTVKPLEWIGGPISQKAACIIGIYLIGRDRVDGLYRWTLLNDNIPAANGTCTNEQSAKAAAQADYEARILSTLQPSPLSEITRLREALRAWIEPYNGFSRADVERRCDPATLRRYDATVSALKEVSND